MIERYDFECESLQIYLSYKNNNNNNKRNKIVDVPKFQERGRGKQREQWVWIS